MKLLSLSLMVAAMISAPSFAEEAVSTPAKAPKSVAEITKKPRKKKVEMCAECGKPESECECEGHGKKEGKGADTKDGHKH